MGKILFIVFLTIMPFFVFAQKIDKAAMEKFDKIKSSEEYIWGEGKGPTEKSASDQAMAILNSQIRTTVKSQFDYVINQTNKRGDIEAEEKMTSIINTYSNNTLNNVDIIILSREPYYVVRYISKTELQKRLEERKKKVSEYVKDAMRYKEEGLIGDALMQFHMAKMLINTCPNANELTIPANYEEVPAYAFIKKQMDDILSTKNITVEEQQIEEDENEYAITLMFKYKGKPVGNLNYSYEAKEKSEVYTAKDGKGEIIIPKDFDRSKLKIYIEYFYNNYNNAIEADVKEVMQNTEGLYPEPYRITTFKKNRSLKPILAHTATPTGVNLNTDARDSTIKVVREITKLTPEEAEPFLSTTNKMEAILRNKKYNEAKELCTAEGYEMFNQLIGYGKAALLSTTAPLLDFYRCGDDITCRSFPMSFSFSTRRKFTENVVFHLNPEGLITEVAFALETPDVNNIMLGKNYDDNTKQVLVNFLERYKTAFALKRLDYIKSIFSNDALIIVGSVLKKAENYQDMAQPSFSHEMVHYTELKKEEYIKNLEKCFKSNEFINVRFADNLIKQGKKMNGKNNFYGIQIKQDYFSKTYGDTGYLFLIVDLENPEKPIINVRTWQPQKDDAFLDGRIGTRDYTW